MHKYTKTFEKLLKAQDHLNSQYDCPEWKTKGHPFCDYIWIETGELLNHDGSVFHYRKQDCDIAQVKLELVDILHFGLSDMLVKGASAETVANAVSGAETGEVVYNPQLLIRHARNVSRDALKGKFDIYWFAKLCNACGFTFDHIAESYFIKYTLNRFRIANGQTRGEYKKIWADGREDNEHLMELASHLSPRTDALYCALAERYAKVS